MASFMSPVRVWAQSPEDLGLPRPGTMVNLTPAYVPVIIKGLRIHPRNPILFDFIIDTGNSGLSTKDQKLKSESEKLIKYFLASLTIPEDDLWVNLSPYEQDRIIPKQLGQTEMGRDMLAEDYILKELTASLIYPEKNLGKEFWNKVYAKAQQLYGVNANEIPVNTFNKVWIVADKAKVYVHQNTVFVVASHLKVMLEEDYLSLEKHKGLSAPNKTHSISSQIVREIILPELEKEVNTGKNFANLRQIFHSMILAAWYKKNLKEALLNQVYSDKAKIKGVDVQDKTIKDKIYKEYLQAYKKGVFNYIKEDNVNGQMVPRKYFSGGEEFMRVFKPEGLEEVGATDPAMRNFGADGAMIDVQAAAHLAGTYVDQEMLQTAQKVGLNPVSMLAQFNESHPNGGGDWRDFVQAKIAQAHAQRRIVFRRSDTAMITRAQEVRNIELPAANESADTDFLKSHGVGAYGLLPGSQETLVNFILHGGDIVPLLKTNGEGAGRVQFKKHDIPYYSSVALFTMWLGQYWHLATVNHKGNGQFIDGKRIDEERVLFQLLAGQMDQDTAVSKLLESWSKKNNDQPWKQQQKSEFEGLLTWATGKLKEIKEAIGPDLNGNGGNGTGTTVQSVSNGGEIGLKI